MSWTWRLPSLRFAGAFAAGALLATVSLVEIVPPQKAQSVATTSATQAQGEEAAVDAGAAGSGPPAAAGSVTAGALAATTPANASARPGITCAAGHNGGATDTGVTASTIHLATTEVQSGPGASFLGDVKYAMEAVVNRVNSGGGICGRRLEIQYVDDGWDASRGAGYLRNFLQQSVFAIPVGPSSEGLRVIIDSGDVDRAQVPVVGSDGMLIDQYRDPWVWPVAVSTASSARIMAADAYQRGARHFSIVFDKNYRFGVEAAEAYNSEVKRLTGAAVAGYNPEHNCQQSFCGIVANNNYYGNEVDTVSRNSGDFMALFLEPTTALQWMATPGVPTATSPSLRFGIGAGQPLFTREFASDCHTPCDQMQVWTGYKPDIEGYADDAKVQAYVSDLHATKPNADEYNAFAEGGYVGMELLVAALRQAGPDLTRVRLREALDSLSLRSGLELQAGGLVPRPGNHFTNITMQAFTVQFKGTFGGWRTGDMVADPNPQAGTS